MSDRPSPRLRSDGDARRAAVLDAAIELFAERGYAGASARAITARAQANVAAINYYFGDKAGLYHAALEAAHGRLLADGVGALGGEPCEAIDPEAGLRAWLEHRLRMASRVRASEGPAAWLLLRAATEAADVPGIEQLVARIAEPMRAEVEGFLARMVPGASPEAVATAAGLLLLVATRFAEAAPELERFNLRPPSCEAELEQFMDGLWTFLHAGVLALLTDSREL